MVMSSCRNRRFQSSSDLQAGCNSSSAAHTGHGHGVSILIRPSGRMQHVSLSHTVESVYVSILIRPSGRMQRLFPLPLRWVARFQSSSDLQAGCNATIPIPVPSSIWFQSSSDLQAGCNIHADGPGEVAGRVSILIRPSGRMQHSGNRLPGADGKVSILIRPSGRMQPSPCRGRRHWWWCFNPHPTFRPDATWGYR